MPTILSHPAVPLLVGLALGSRTVSPRLLVAGMVASVLPDLDVLAFRFGIAYAHEWGHRGFSHSLLTALLLGGLAMAAARVLRARPGVAFAFVAGAALSHGLLDMLTNGGLGVALGWPWSDTRHFLPWRVIEVSPLSLTRFVGPAGLTVLRSEVLWVWAPCTVVATAIWAGRRLVAGPSRRGVQAVPAAPAAPAAPATSARPSPGDR